jgi:hypothetical protein
MRRFTMTRCAFNLLGAASFGISACTVNVGTTGPAGGGGGPAVATPAPTAPAATTAPAAPATTAPAAPGTPPPAAVPAAPAPAAPAPTAAPATPEPGPTQRPYHFDSNHNATGVLGKVRLELGTRTFKGTHGGKYNFRVLLFPPGVEPAPNLLSTIFIFSEIGSGSWTYQLQVMQAGEYALELANADGPWTLSIE